MALVLIAGCEPDPRRAGLLRHFLADELQDHALALITRNRNLIAAAGLAVTGEVEETDGGAHELLCCPERAERPERAS